MEKWYFVLPLCLACGALVSSYTPHGCAQSVAFNVLQREQVISSEFTDDSLGNCSETAITLAEGLIEAYDEVKDLVGEYRVVGHTVHILEPKSQKYKGYKHNPFVADFNSLLNEKLSNVKLLRKLQETTKERFHGAGFAGCTTQTEQAEENCQRIFLRRTYGVLVFRTGDDYDVLANEFGRPLPDLPISVEVFIEAIKFSKYWINRKYEGSIVNHLWYSHPVPSTLNKKLQQSQSLAPVDGGTTKQIEEAIPKATSIQPHVSNTPDSNSPVQIFCLKELWGQILEFDEEEEERPTPKGQSPQNVSYAFLIVTTKEGPKSYLAYAFVKKNPNVLLSIAKPDGNYLRNVPDTGSPRVPLPLLSSGSQENRCKTQTAREPTYYSEKTFFGLKYSTRDLLERIYEVVYKVRKVQYWIGERNILVRSSKLEGKALLELDKDSTKKNAFGKKARTCDYKRYMVKYMIVTARTPEEFVKNIEPAIREEYTFKPGHMYWAERFDIKRKELKPIIGAAVKYLVNDLYLLTLVIAPKPKQNEGNMVVILSATGDTL